MPREISLLGVLLPALVPVFIGCLLLMVLIDMLAGRLGLYRHVWHPSLFRCALFFCLFGVAGLWLLH